MRVRGSSAGHTEPQAQSDAPEHGTSEVPAISVRNVGKEFHRPREHYTTLKEHVLSPRRVRTGRMLRALDDVSFEIAQGEFFGIIGRNGSGKSTLLRCLSQIYRPDQGEIRVLGRLAPFIELGVGFNGDMAARDNVIVNAVLLGLSPQEARRRFDEIVVFAELEDFVDLKLKNYSSGMITRLAFAVTVHVDADVLLLDEVLAVGDAAFQQKCYAHFDELRRTGRTVILVTHDKALVERFCERVLLLHQGRVVDIGEPRAVLRRYSELIAKEARPLASPNDTAAVRARLDGWFEDAQGTSVRSIRQGEECTACLLVTPHFPVEAPIVTIAIENRDEQAVFATSAGYEALAPLRSGARALIRVRLANVFAPGGYAAHAELLDGNRPVVSSKLVAPLLVLADPTRAEPSDLAYEIEVRRP